ncbi:uncharacterized protein LOC107980666 isoform X2 [Nasonia vitripennis]|uniref:CHCH domain-containing protein n=1 Tax=Nasonia vitripennis TaxID=7425 RepID=A0A7M7Q305_NASVI|nr:uncharacterized protein LOC107980666 isoform X2 [Nasonia vitripennis]
MRVLVCATRTRERERNEKRARVEARVAAAADDAAAAAAREEVKRERRRCCWNFAEVRVRAVMASLHRGDVVIIQPVPRQPGVLGTFAGTAAGVAAGTVIGDKITGRSESDSSSLAPPAGVPPSGPCQYDELQLLGCAQNEEDLRICESFRQAWLDCKRKYNLT